MSNEISEKQREQLKKLEVKFESMGQDLSSYLDGLLHADYLTYWDYIHLDTLLSLQNPKTAIPDERIFIIYHQITELYFKLTIQAIEQVIEAENLTLEFFKRQLKRMNSYFQNLIHSFDIMVDGMDQEEFLKFRMSLLPASGFQSAQYRIIELLSTPINNLVYEQKRSEQVGKAPKDVLKSIYWNKGATELKSGKKTLTLKQFEQKYGQKFADLAENHFNNNIYSAYLALSEEDQKDSEIIDLLREFDLKVGVQWPLMHYKSAVRYLHKDPVDIAATGGTNWQKYLPPRYQRIILFPSLHSDEEKANWGVRGVKK